MWCANITSRFVASNSRFRNPSSTMSGFTAFFHFICKKARQQCFKLQLLLVAIINIDIYDLWICNIDQPNPSIIYVRYCRYDILLLTHHPPLCGYHVSLHQKFYNSSSQVISIYSGNCRRMSLTEKITSNVQSAYLKNRFQSH